MQTHEYSLELKNDLSELQTLYRHLDTFGQRAGLTEACIADINVCLEELFTNTVYYGFVDDLERTIQFTLNLNDYVLTLKIEDDGLSFNPLGKKDPEIPADLIDVRIGGLGIHIVRKLMDDIRYERKRGKNKMTLKKVIS